MAKNQTYSEVENAAIKQWFKEKLTDEQIAAKLPGRTASAIQVHRSVLGAVNFKKKGRYKRQKANPGSQLNIDIY